MSLYRPCFQLFEIGVKRSSLNVEIYSAGRHPIKGRILSSEKWQQCRGFKERKSAPQLVPSNNGIQELPISWNSLVKPLLFTAGFSTTTFVGCTIWQYENLRAQAKNYQGRLRSIQDGWFPERIKTGGIRQYCNDLWNQLSEGQKTFAPVLFINLLVFGAWRIPRFQPTMMTFFASNPAARVVCWPMLLSTFSHYSVLHLAANMYVLHSFSPLVVNSLGKEQATALYLSAGVIASFTSLLHKVSIAKPGLSVGASGAIMAVLGFVCTQYPDAQLAIILLPMWTFTAGAAIKAVIAFDSLGVLLGWKFFDHAAHLGGALTGMAYCYWGNDYIWRKREAILRLWHDFRTSTT